MERLSDFSEVTQLWGSLGLRSSDSSAALGGDSDDVTGL